VLCDTCGKTTSGASTTEPPRTEGPACKDGEIEVVPFSEKADRLCRVPAEGFNFTKGVLPVKAKVTDSQGDVAISGLMTPADQGGYTTTLQLATSVSNGKVTASLPTLSSNLGTTLSTKLLPATSVLGFLRNSKVYHDSLRIAVSFQVREDTTFSTATSGSNKVKVFAHNADGVLAKSTEIPCSGKTGGICSGYLTLDEDYCDQLDEDAELTISYRLFVGDDAVTTASAFDKTVTAVKTPTDVTDDVKDTAYLAVPSHGMIAGEEYQVTVRSRFTKYLSEAQLVLEVGDGLKLKRGSVVLSTAFSEAKGDLSSSSQGLSVLFAGRKDGMSNDELDEPSNEVLFSVTIVADGDVNAGESATIKMTKFSETKDIGEAPLKLSDDAGAGAIYSRAGVVSGDNAAEVHFVDNPVAAVFAYATKPTELLNTATFSGAKITVPITVRSIKMRGGVANLAASQVECESSDADALGAASSGCKAELTGDEEKGSEKVLINVKATPEDGVEFAIKVPFRVYLAVADTVKLTLSQTTLRAVAGWYVSDDDSCNGFKYQTATAVVTAAFSDGKTTVVDEYDVSSIARLSSTKGEVAVVATDTGLPVVTGANPGDDDVEASIRVLRGAGTDAAYDDASVEVTVKTTAAENRVAVVGLDATVLADLGGLTVEPAEGEQPRGTSMVVTGAAPTTKKLQFEKDRMEVVVSAVLEDHTRVLLDGDNGLVLPRWQTRRYRFRTIDSLWYRMMPWRPMDRL
jgi:hypothetical protein